MKHPAWLWINLLSLDAPIVALVWQDFLARRYPSTLLPAGRIVLGLTVWAIYLADRLFDVRHPAAADETTRHRYYRQNAGIMKALLLTVLLADLLTAVFWLRPIVLTSGLLTTAAVASYLAVFAVLRLGGTLWKQGSAAILFTAGVFLVAWTGVPNPWNTLAPAAASFCGLCLFNLVLIERWEDHDQAASASIWIAIAGVLCALLGSSPWFAAVACGAVVLAILDFQGGKLSQDARHLLADAALLTPLLFR